MVGDHDTPRLPLQVGRDSAGEQRLEAAARLRHVAAALVPAQRGRPTGPRAR
ncbi:hypothetical protein [Actinomycetospora sp. NBRC 106378]|uniref:hypothetical protein n=1 Tax=Actinomycetospora sp. NBRC 106378 TaxID=3032208 RepID=UPI00255417B5|nr:hypothetical protein [Actinomycetospora sp. NBRC 106378]